MIPAILLLALPCAARPFGDSVPLVMLPPSVVKDPTPANAFVPFNSDYPGTQLPVHTLHATKFMTVTITVQAQPTQLQLPPSPPPTKPFMATYFPDWTANEFPPEKIDFARFTWIDFGKFLTLPSLHSLTRF